MPAELRADGSMIFTGVGLYRLVVLYHALKLQAETGMKASRISAVACAKRLGYVGRTAKTLLADMERKHPELKKRNCAKRLGYVGITAKTLLADMERMHPELKKRNNDVA